MTKTSELPQAAALNGTEVFALIQSGTTKRVLLSSVSTFVLGNVGTRLAAVETAVSANATAIGAVATRVGSAETAIGTNATAIGTVAGRVSNAETAIGTLSTRTGNVESALSALGSAHNSLATAVTGLSTRVGNNETAVSALGVRVKAIEDAGGGGGGGGDPELEARVEAIEAYGVDATVFRPAVAYSTKRTGDVGTPFRTLFPEVTAATVTITFALAATQPIGISFAANDNLLDVFYRIQASLPPGLSVYFDYGTLGDEGKIGLRFESPSDFSISAGDGYVPALGLVGSYQTSTDVSRRLVRTTDVDHFGASLSDVVSAIFGTQSDLYDRYGRLEQASPRQGTSIFVPDDYPTLGEALTWVRQNTFRSGSRVEILMADGLYSEALDFVDEDLSHVTVRGSPPAVYRTTNGAYSASEVSTGQYNVVFNLASASSRFSVGDYVNLYGDDASVAPMEAYARLFGYWRVVAVTATTVTLRVTATYNFGAADLGVTWKMSKFRVAFFSNARFLRASGSRLPSFRDIGFIGNNATGSIAVDVSASELDMSGIPQWDGASPAPRVSFTGFEIALFARSGSRVVADICASACVGPDPSKPAVWVAGSSKLLSPRFLVVNGNKSRGMNVTEDSIVAASLGSMSTKRHPTVVGCNGDIGVCVYDLGRATFDAAMIRGNISQDVYAGDSAHVTLDVCNVAITSPSVNTLGNNNAYIRSY